MAAYRMYMDLSDGAKAKVTKLSVLEAAEKALAELRNTVYKNSFDHTLQTEPAPNKQSGGKIWLIVGIGVAVAVAVAAVVAVVVIHRKKQRKEAQ